MTSISKIPIIAILAMTIAMGLNTKARAQTIRFISVAQTNARVLMHDEFAANEKYFREYVDGLSVSLGMPVLSAPIAADKYSCEEILKTVTAATAASEANDIVIFYYSGHGDAFGPSEFPRIECAKLQSDPQPFLEDIYKDLRKSKSRFIFVGADTCNDTVQTLSKPTDDLIAELRTKSGVQQRNDLVLFKDFKGGVLTTSSKQKERSFYFKRSHGRFTERLIKELTKKITSPAGALAWSNAKKAIEAPPIDVRDHDQQIGENPKQLEQHPVLQSTETYIGKEGPVDR